LYHHILIGLNQSDAAHRALLQAIHLAANFNATLTAMAVTPALPLYAAYAVAAGPEALQIMERDQQTSFAELLETARSEAAQHAIKIETVLSDGPVMVSLFEAVQTNHIDLLVLGINPNQDLLGWPSGSIAHELAVRVPCDVLGVH
jgi:nucleotide-binding universal stress UspA family protein